MAYLLRIYGFKAEPSSALIGPLVSATVRWPMENKANCLSHVRCGAPLSVSTGLQRMDRVMEQSFRRT